MGGVCLGADVESLSPRPANAGAQSGERDDLVSEYFHPPDQCEKQTLGPVVWRSAYKAVLVESEAVDPQSRSRPAEYLPTLINYVHLNPARAGIVDAGKNPDASLLDYAWSSLGTAYAVPPSKRPGWMEVADGLGRMNFRDTAAGRRKYVEYLNERMRQEKAEKLGLAEIDGQTLHSTLRRGWYWGSQEFREKILDRFGEAIGGKTKTNRTLRSSAAAKDNSIRRAEEILAEGMEYFELDEDEFRIPKRGDHRVLAIAWAMWSRTSGVSLAWIAERCGLKSAANAGQRIRGFAAKADKELPVKIRKWRKRWNR